VNHCSNQGGINDRYFSGLLNAATILRHNKNEEIALKVKDGTADVLGHGQCGSPLLGPAVFRSLMSRHPPEDIHHGHEGFN